MQVAAILLLLIVHSIAISGFGGLFIEILNIAYSPIFFGFVLTLVGIILGFVFFGLSSLQQKIKRYVMLFIPGFIFLIIILSYLALGLSAMAETIIFLLKISIILLLCSMPLIGVFSILKQQKNVLIVAGIGVMFFYFFSIFLSNITEQIQVPFYNSLELFQLTLFFILSIAFIEIGINSIDFSSMAKRIAPNEFIDPFLLNSFSKIFYRYIAHISILILAVLGVSLFFVYNFNSVSGNDFMGIDLSSTFGIILLVSITILSSFIFWVIIPREKSSNDKE